MLRQLELLQRRLTFVGRTPGLALGDLDTTAPVRAADDALRVGDLVRLAEHARGGALTMRLAARNLYPSSFGKLVYEIDYEGDEDTGKVRTLDGREDRYRLDHLVRVPTVTPDPVCTYLETVSDDGQTPAAAPKLEPGLAVTNNAPKDAEPGMAEGSYGASFTILSSTSAVGLSEICVGLASSENSSYDPQRGKHHFVIGWSSDGSMHGLENYYGADDGFDWSGPAFGVGDVVALRVDNSVEASEEPDPHFSNGELGAVWSRRKLAPNRRCKHTSNPTTTISRDASDRLLVVADAGKTLTAYINGERAGMMAIRVSCSRRWVVQLSSAGDAVRITEGTFTGLDTCTASEAEAEAEEIQGLVAQHREAEQMEEEAQMEKRYEEESDRRYSGMSEDY